MLVSALLIMVTAVLLLSKVDWGQRIMLFMLMLCLLFSAFDAGVSAAMRHCLVSDNYIQPE